MNVYPNGLIHNFTPTASGDMYRILGTGRAYDEKVEVGTLVTIWSDMGFSITKNIVASKTKLKVRGCC